MKFATVVFDFDSTLVDFETLERVIELSLEGRPDKNVVFAEIKNITEQGLRGEIGFNESLARRMALVAPRKEYVQKVADELVQHITVSVLENKDFFKKHADSVFIVSHGFDELIFPASDKLGISRAHVFANEFVYDTAGNATGADQSRPLSQKLGKITALKGASLPHPIAMVGDGYTDYEVKKHGAADVFIAYVEHTHRESVIANADVVARSFNEVRLFLERA